MKNKWLKVISRNQAPLHWSALLHIRQNGIVAGKIWWKSNHDLLIIDKNPLGNLFIDVREPPQTNLPLFIKKINSDLTESINKSLKIIEKGLLIEPGSRNDLLDIYNVFKINMGLMVAGYYWVDIICKKIEKSVGDEMWNNIKNKVVHPYKPTLIVKEHEAIVKSQTKDEKSLKENAKNLAMSFGFIHSEYRGNVWNADDYIREIKSETKKIDSNPHNIKSDLKNYKLTDFQLWLIEIAQKYYYVYDQGKASLVKANWALRTTLKNLGYEEKDILNCNEEEFFNFISNGNIPPIKQLSEREKYYGILIFSKKYIECIGKKDVGMLIKKERITELKNYQNILEIKGQSAFAGKAQGKVRILYSQRDAENFKDGEILVASMTTPELIVAMRKSLAFITDEGGITSHAAIIARELKIPCVVGTKIATKVLKDGDLVEVDADKGIVKIISVA